MDANLYDVYDVGIQDKTIGLNPTRDNDTYGVIT